MTLKSLLAATTCALLATTAAQAGTFNGLTMTTGYDHVDREVVEDDRALWGKFETGMTFGALSVDGGLGYADYADHAAIFSLAPTVASGHGLTAGLFMDRARFDNGNELDTLHYGLTAEYEVDALDLAGYWGQGEYDDGMTLESDVFGLSANYGFTDAFNAGLFFDREDIEDFRIDGYGIEAGYLFNIQGQPLYASASYTEFNMGDDARFGVMFSVPYGGKVDTGTKRFHDHSMAAALIAD